MDGDYRLELKDVSKSFGEVHALKGVDLEIDWIHSVELEKNGDLSQLDRADGILVPGGFGDRGIEGKMFRPMALTVVFAMGGSLVCALTLMPVLASIFLKKPINEEVFLMTVERIIDGAERKRANVN